MNDPSVKDYLALPPSGAGPGVLVLHAWWGLNDTFKGVCDRLAQEGFVALAPDFYYGKLATTIDEAMTLRSKADSNQEAAGVLAGLEQLRALPQRSGEMLGVVGFSLGAAWALWLAEEQPEWIKAVTVFYGTGGEDAKRSQSAYLGHFAENDDWESAEDVERLEKNLRIANRPATFYTYPGTGHWFFEPDRPAAYNPAAAQLAWQRTVEFFHAQL
jgi:carboxymethylenebutenolidase